MTYQELEAKLVDYVYDELAEAERDAFEAGLREHPDLAEEAKAHARTRSVMASVEPVSPPQSVLYEVMRQARAEVAVQEKKSWLESVLGFLMQPAVATAMIFLLVASASLMLSDDALNDSTRVEKQPLAVATGKEEGKVGGASAVERGGAEVAAVEPEKVTTLQVAAAAPAPEEAAESKSLEIAVAEAPKVPIGTRKRRAKPAGTKKDSVEDGLRNVAIQLAEQNTGLSREKALGGGFDEAPLALGLSTGGLAGGPRAGGMGSGYGGVTRQEAPKQKADGPSVASKGKSKAKSAKGPSRGERLLRKYRSYLKKGRYEHAGRALRSLAKLPDFAAVAAREKKRLAKLRASSKKAPKRKPKNSNGYAPLR